MKQLFIILTAVVVLAALVFYVSGIWHTLSLPPKLVNGPISYIDKTQNHIAIGTGPSTAIRCSFSFDMLKQIQNLKKGDVVTATIGYIPDLIRPNCRSYKLLSLSAHDTAEQGAAANP